MQSNPQPVFRALADPTRRQILLSLKQKEQTIGEVATQFDITRAAVKKHLNILEQGQLIKVEIRGRERVNHLQPENMQAAVDWLNHFSEFWDTRLSALQTAINDTRQ